MDIHGETVFKIVVTGPFNAGKTTFIETVVEREFVTTGAQTTSSDEVRVKRATTIGMDFGVLTLADPDGDIELRIYGTPGQERFSFMWEVLAEGADAYVLLVNGEDEQSWVMARSHYAVMERVGIPGVLGINRGDEHRVELARTYFADLPLKVMGLQANQIEDVKAVLIETLVAILSRLEPDSFAVDDATPTHVPLATEG
jgi:uncharacterized protein